MATKRNNGELSKRKTKKRLKKIGGGEGFWVKSGKGQKLIRYRKNPRTIQAVATKTIRKGERFDIQL